MNIFVAGGSGTIGVPLVQALVAGGHQVVALTRSPSKQPDLRALGASPIVGDALNRESLVAAVVAARPTHVIHQLTALPRNGPRRARDLDRTNQLRTEGTRNLLDAAIRAGAKRFIVGSFAILSPRAPAPGRSDDAAAAAVRSMEEQVLDATRRGAVEGVILRYGMFYGPEIPSTTAMIALVRRHRLPVVRDDKGQLPLIHVDDAVSATVLALDHAPAAAVYEIVDDRPMSFSAVVEAIAEYTGSPAPWRLPAWLPRLIAPYMARMTSVRLALSNQEARRELGWHPAYPTMREGLAHIFGQAG